MSQGHDLCRSCGAKIVWAKNKKTRRSAPIDAEPTDGGNIVLTDNEYTVVNPAEMLPGTPLHLNHFVTCPHAKEWKKATEE